MHKSLQIAIVAALTLTQAHAAEIATLRNGFSIRHEKHETQGQTTRLYLSSESPGSYIDVNTVDIESFEAAPPDTQASNGVSGTRNLQAVISDASARSQIDADFIASVIRAESGGNPRAVSRKGAQGLMQLMPQTANQLGVSNSFDPEENVEGGVRYLRELLLQYNGDAVKALAAYNAGPQRVQQYNGVPPYRETHAYVARVINDYNRKKTAEMKKNKQTAAAHRVKSSEEAVASGGR